MQNKKSYSKPQVEEEQLELEDIIAASANFNDGSIPLKDDDLIKDLMP